MPSFLRSKALAPLLTVLRIWLGWEWLQAGWHKLSDPRWMRGGEALQGFWARAVGALPESQPAIKYGWYKAFIQGLLDGGHYSWFAKLVVLGEILTGLALILGAATVFALFVGAFMNLNFMLAGTASTNPVMYTVAILLLVAGPAAYQYGLDRLLLPYLQRVLRREGEALAG
ncbi:DoxX family membrane protein [Thermanaeromonas sp. C210]|uniref:DoxX family membrane protein n=1 Tax=Thermanaeromonas sp. C210 TaxID=2731925 RepID=UPI00155B41E3|nr:DoxX family membrane protein [Thermanaeromonas sp. C210]GFN23079.1 hypothetical protein TAMC210_13960 [Thermanaeromonas sp. C210]